MLQVSVSNLDLFRTWKQSEDLDTDWLLSKLLSREQTPQMMAGEAFHKALETVDFEAEVGTLAHGDYRFDFNCDAEVTLTPFKEAWISKEYGEIQVRGRVDSVVGLEIVDYKTTANFDPDRYMNGYQWRYYLDMAYCRKFTWKVFVMSEFGPENCYEVKQFHQLSQYRYPGMEQDCRRLATEYAEFMKVIA